MIDKYALFIFALGLCILDVTYRRYRDALRTTPCWHAHPLPFSVYILEGDSIDRLSLAVNNNTAQLAGTTFLIHVAWLASISTPGSNLNHLDT